MPTFQRVMPGVAGGGFGEGCRVVYAEVLGFGVCWRAANDGGGGNCMLEAGRRRCCYRPGRIWGSKPAFTGTLYFEMKGEEEFYGRVKDGVEMAWPAGSMESGGRGVGGGGSTQW